MTFGEEFLIGDFSVISLNILLQISSSDCAWTQKVNVRMNKIINFISFFYNNNDTLKIINVR